MKLMGGKYALVLSLLCLVSCMCVDARGKSRRRSGGRKPTIETDSPGEEASSENVDSESEEVHPQEDEASTTKKDDGKSGEKPFIPVRGNSRRRSGGRKPTIETDSPGEEASPENIDSESEEVQPLEDESSTTKKDVGKSGAQPFIPVRGNSRRRSGGRGPTIEIYPPGEEASPENVDSEPEAAEKPEKVQPLENESSKTTAKDNGKSAISKPSRNYRRKDESKNSDKAPANAEKSSTSTAAENEEIETEASPKKSSGGAGGTRKSSRGRKKYSYSDKTPKKAKKSSPSAEAESAETNSEAKPKKRSGEAGGTGRDSRERNQNSDKTPANAEKSSPSAGAENAEPKISLKRSGEKEGTNKSSRGRKKSKKSKKARKSSPSARAEKAKKKSKAKTKKRSGGASGIRKKSRGSSRRTSATRAEA